VKLYLPGRDNIPFFKRFVRDFMALYKYNQLVIELNAAMRLDRHPELNAGWIEFARDLIFSRRDRPTGPHQEYQNSTHHDTGDGGVLEKDEVAGLVRWARQHYIEVIPELPSLTHAYYLLTRHRELAEIQEDEWPDAYCPSNPKSYDLLFDVFDEYIEVMKPRMMHVGHDEWRAPVGVCPRCRGKDSRELFAADVNKIHSYLAAKKIGTTIWGDHLLEGVRGKAVSDRVSPTGYKHQWPGALTPEQVRQKIPKDILIANWFWGEGKAGEAESYQAQLENWGFRQIFGNFTPSFRDWGRRSAAPSVLGGLPSSWSATTEFNFGKDLMYDLLGCANLLWSKHWPDPKELTGVVQAQLPSIRVRLSGIAPPSADPDPVVPVKLAAGQTKAILVGEDASSLIFLHASDKPATNDWTHRYIYNFDDTADLLGHYEVLYEDGFVATIPIRYGVNILERTWGARRNPRSYCYRADPVDSDGETFFSFEWVNPRLGKVIKQISLTPSSGFRGTNRKVIAENPVLLKALSFVEKRTSPEPGKARSYGGGR
jgi:hexosaminidase